MASTGVPPLVCASLLLWTTLSTGCNASPVKPTEPRPDDPNPPSVIVAGQVVDALSDQPLPGVSIRIDGFPEITSGADGRFTLTAAPVAEQARFVTIVSPDTVERFAQIRVPGAHARLTLIPKSFDLTAFDQMYRGNGFLRRWTTAPRLVVQRQVLTFTNTSASQYSATAMAMSDGEVNDLIEDLLWTLPQLTGQTFTAFADQRVESVDDGVMVPVQRSSTIVVARYDGLEAATGYAGYGRWSWNGAGEIIGGIVMLDRAWEERVTASRRRALRAHELGHALGWNHVERLPSVMNQVALLPPTEFDRHGAAIAFLRSPLNQSPDRDVPSSTLNREIDKQVVWAGAP